MVVAVGVGGLCVNEEVKREIGVRRSGVKFIKAAGGWKKETKEQR